MIRLVQNNLIIPRGDTGTFSIPVLSSLGEAVGVFTVLDPRTNTKVFEKQVSPSGETLTVVFSHGDTVNLPVGKFLWDIKFYLNPVFADGKLIDGVEVNSYYAAYKLPYCEIRQTGDNLLTSDGSPSTTITPESLNVLEAIANEVVTAKNEATQAAESASASASAAEEYAGQITGLSATAETLPSEQPATASYDAETGVLTIGVPKGEAFQIAKEYSSVAAMNADYNNSNIRIGDFVVISSTVEDPDNAKIYVKGEEAYVFVVDMSGPAGDEYTVMVQDTQPTQETNKLWIPISQGMVQEVPTVTEMQEALSGKADKVDTVLETTLSRGRKEGTTVGEASVAFGIDVEASGILSHAEGYNCIASGIQTHAEGGGTIASGGLSHAEGSATRSNGYASHSEGYQTIANGYHSHAEGDYNVLDDHSNWHEWQSNTSYFIGDKVKITTATNDGTTVKGYICKQDNSDEIFTKSHWKADYKINYVHIVGNGTDNDHRSNAYALDWDGNGHYAGDVYVGANPDSTGGEKLATEAYVDNAVGDVSIPVEDVQVNNTSIVDANGIANIQKASSDNLGVVGIEPQSGVAITSSGKLEINPASTADIKKGENTNKPIVVFKQDAAAFYGLATAAGDETQSQSSNSVGSYTDEAKTAINNMLGSATKEELATLDYAPAIHMTTPSNTFTDGVEGRPVACTIELKPTQTGSGTPSASNVRTITGYQEAYLWRSNDENHTALSTDPFTGGIGATAAKFVALSPFQPLEAYRISRAELVADKHYRVEFDLEISGTTETNRPSVYIGNTMPTSGTSGIATKVSENNGHYTIDFNTNAQQLYSGNVFSFSPLSFRNNVQNVQFTISNLSLIETDSWYLSIPEEAQDVYGESMSMDENFHLITVENKAFFGGVFTIDTDGNTVLTKTHKCIRSYNGETLPGVWISDRDEYAPGTTPTTGALVVYELAEADRETYVISKHYITSLAGVNVFTSDVGTVSIDGYTADTKMYIDNAAAGGVQDVQINGVSVLDAQGVVNVPIATNSTLGVVKAGAGLFMLNGSLTVSAAPSIFIQTGMVGSSNPIVPGNQHESAFYGLAKAAGDATQSQSDNPVGTYTDEAKTAIQSMLGIAQVATAEEVAEIITSYEEDEDMIFEMTIVNKGHGEFEYKSADPTETILDAYTSGKHVILHFPYSESLTLPNCYASILSYNEEEERLTFGGLNIGEFLLTELSIDGDEYITITP